VITTPVRLSQCTLCHLCLGTCRPSPLRPPHAHRLRPCPFTFPCPRSFPSSSLALCVLLQAPDHVVALVDHWGWAAGVGGPLYVWAWRGGKEQGLVGGGANWGRGMCRGRLQRGLRGARHIFGILFLWKCGIGTDMYVPYLRAAQVQKGILHALDRMMLWVWAGFIAPDDAGTGYSVHSSVWP
jgi:hypothetical protein